MTLVAIFGPTGSGKTDVAVRVAAQLGTEVVNCDPAQCYDALPVLTNKPTPEQARFARHRLVGVWAPSHEGTVGEFATMARAASDGLIEEHGSAVLCGGS